MPWHPYDPAPRAYPGFAGSPEPCRICCKGKADHEAAPVAEDALPNIERELRLHQRLSVIYVVDGYEAALEYENGTDDVCAHGESFLMALSALDSKLR